MMISFLYQPCSYHKTACMYQCMKWQTPVIREAAREMDAEFQADRGANNAWTPLGVFTYHANTKYFIFHPLH
jgi:hypothetical protein